MAIFSGEALLRDGSKLNTTGKIEWLLQSKLCFLLSNQNWPLFPNYVYSGKCYASTHKKSDWNVATTNDNKLYVFNYEKKM